MAFNFSAVDSFLSNATTTLKAISNDISSGLPSTTPSSLGNMANFGSTAQAATDGITQAYLNDFENTITGGIKSGFDAISGEFSKLQNGIANVLQESFDGIGNVLNDLKGAIGGAISNLAGSVETGFSAVVQDVGSGLDFLYNDLKDGFGQIGSAIVTSVGNEITAVTGGIAGLAKAIGSPLEALANGVSGIANDILNTMLTLPQAIDKAIVGVTEGFGKAIASGGVELIKTLIDTGLMQDILNPVKDVGLWMGNIIKNSFTEFLPILDEPPDANFASDMERIVAGGIVEQIIGQLEDVAPGAAFILAGLLNKLIESLNIGFYRDIEHIGNWQYPNRDLDIGTLIDGRYRGSVDDTLYYNELRKQGVNKEYADILYSNGETLLQLNELVALYYRGIIPDLKDLYIQGNEIHAERLIINGYVELFKKLFPANTSIELWRRNVKPNGFVDYFDDLRKDGWTDDRIKALQNISYVIPQPTMLREFIIKQAYNDELAAKFGLDEGIDENYYIRALANGWTRDDAKLLYRSQWAFPPFFILESLYKSGEISKDDFSAIMKFTGIPSYFISSFSKSLAPKLTTSDIKDMYKYQIITADQITDELSKIGITGELASQYKSLWVASVKLAPINDQTSTQTKAAKIKGLSEGLIKENYTEGSITKEQAVNYLKEINYEDDEINLTINTWDYSIRQTYVKQTIQDIKEQARVRSITFNDAVNAIQKLNLSPIQTSTYITEVEQYMKVKDKIPTLAEVTKWFKDSLLTVTEYINALRLLGYSDAWIPYYLVAAGMTQDEVTSLGLTFTAFST